MPRYHCTNCDHHFDHPGGRLRCPKCLRQNGLEELSARQRLRGRRAPFKRLALLAGLLLCAVTLGVVVTKVISERQAAPPPGALAQLDSAALVGALIARGIPAKEALDPFGPSPVVAKLVGDLPTGDPAKRARAVAGALAGHLSTVEVDLMGAGRLAGPPLRTGAELAHALQTKQATSALSYELSALLLTALRQSGLVALLCEASEQKAPVRVADPSGALGRYAVAVYASPDKLGDPPLLLLDAARAARLPEWAGGGADSSMNSVLTEPRPLDDASAAARLYALRALQQIDRDAQRPERAYQLWQWAQDASAPSATLLTSRALVLAKAGGIEDAIAASRRALRLHTNPARRTVLAGLLLAQRKSGEAELERQQAIEQDDTFWPAYRSLAALRWMAGDRGGGDIQLERAKALAPEEPTVIALVANQKLSAGETGAALKLLAEVVRREPSEQSLLQLYIGLMQARQLAAAEPVRAKLLEIAGDKEQMRELLDRVAESVGAGAAPQPPSAGGATPAPGEPGAAPAPGTGLTPEGFKLPDVALDPPQ